MKKKDESSQMGHGLKEPGVGVPEALRLFLVGVSLNMVATICPRKLSLPKIQTLFYRKYDSVMISAADEV